MTTTLAQEFQLVRQHATVWAITSLQGTANSQFLKQLQNKNSAWVSFRHPFKTLSNTTDFYYQQRYNSFDSDDAPTVESLLQDAGSGATGNWTYGRVVEKLTLGSLLDKQVIKLSNGETRRVLVGSALLKNPGTLLLDHPLTGLDRATRAGFSQLIKEIADSGIEVLMAVAPHDIPENMDRVLLLQDGSMKEYSSPQAFQEEFPNSSVQLPIDIPLLQHLLGFRKPGKYQTLIDMQNISIRYGDRLLLDQINWTVKPGEHWVVEGPNGAGKSTLLSLITGDNPQAYANQLWLFDRKRGSGESIWDIKQKIGFVSPELFQYFPTDIICRHVVESGFYDTIGLFRPSEPLRAGIVQQWMHLLHLGEYAGQLFSRVPSDVQRLCLLARALVKNPPLLVLDEPTQGLDEPEQDFFTRLIEKIADSTDTSIIYVSHYESHIPKNFQQRFRLMAGRQID